MKNLILEEVICLWFPIQTQLFLTALPTRRDGAENLDNIKGLSSCAAASTTPNLQLKCMEN